MTSKFLPRPLILSLLICLLFQTRTYPVHAAVSTSLLNVRDIVNTLGSGETSEHAVYFTLPYNASPVLTTDYIQIYLPAFTNLTPPIRVDGPHGGTPVFSVSGNYVRITGITVVPGASISIFGITTKNPQLEWLMYATVMITEDADATIIKNMLQVASSRAGPSATVTASIDTPEARIIISGYTAPNTFVTFTEQGAVIGTDVAGDDGHFGIVFSGLQPGNHQISFFGTDSNRLVTSPVIIDVYAPAFQETTVANQILSPTIMINKTVFSHGENIIATGSAVPNGAITLFTEAPLRSYNATASADGTWTYTVDNTSEYVFGDYHIHALVQNDINLTSLTSPSIGFTISSTGSTGSACGDISHGDLNCDGIVDLTDFSIIMYYWGTNNAAADINNDKLVDLTDFSIIMYYWGSA